MNVSVTSRASCNRSALARSGRGRSRVAEHDRLRHLAGQLQPLGAAALRVEHVADHADHARLGELAGGEVDAQAELVAGAPRLVPVADLAARLLQHPPAD